MKQPGHIAVVLGLGLVSVSAFASARQERPAAVPSLPRIERCTQNCLVTIGALRDVYKPGERVQLSIQNQTKKRILVIVSVDGQYNRGWIEIMASVMEPDRPLEMVVRGATLIEAGKARVFSYDPWTALKALAKILPAGTERPTVLRIMVHVYPGGEYSQDVASKTFRLVETRDSH